MTCNLNNEPLEYLKLIIVLLIAVLCSVLFVAFMVMKKKEKNTKLVKSESVDKKNEKIISSEKVSDNNNLLVTTTTTTNSMSTDSSGAVIRAALNHLQIISIISRFEFNWPVTVSNFFAVGDAIGSASIVNNNFNLNVFETSVKCLLYLSWLPAPFNELVVNIFILLVNAGVIILYWSVVSKCGKGSKAADAWYNIKLSIMTLCYLMYSKILTAFLQLFSCTTFNSTFSTPRLEGALDVKCSFRDPVYSKYMSSIGFTTLLYIFGLPLVSFIIILRSNRDDKNVLSTYGFLYGGIVYLYIYIYVYVYII